jgi:hypothetical protein
MTTKILHEDILAASKKVIEEVENMTEEELLTALEEVKYGPVARAVYPFEDQSDEEE